jgi:hypothetical protein
MWTRKIESGWGSKKNNTHAFNLPSNAKIFENFTISCEVKQGSENLTFKLHDDSGCDYFLPHSFQKNSIDKFTIITDGCSDSGDYQFNCVTTAAPNLQPPTAKFFSITTVEISLQQSSKGPRVDMHAIQTKFRRKGADEWIIGNQITFKNCDEIYECQAYNVVPNGTTIQSPIMECRCMWQSFDFEKDCPVDLDSLFLKRKIALLINPQSVRNTEYTVSIRLIDTKEHPENNKELIVQAHPRNKIDDYQLVPGARYEIKLLVENLNVSFTKSIKVPRLKPVDNDVWTKHFGDVDQFGFFWMQGFYLSALHFTFLTLYKSGFLCYKTKFQNLGGTVSEDQLKWAASVNLTPIDDETVRVDYLKLWTMNGTKDEPIRAKRILAPNSSPNTSKAGLAQGPKALQLPEIMKLVTYNIENADRMALRLVCKSWSSLIQPIITCSFTRETVNSFPGMILVETDKVRQFRDEEGAFWQYEYRYDDP